MFIPSGSIVVRAVLLLGALSAAWLLLTILDAGVLTRYLELWDQRFVDYLTPQECWLMSRQACA